MGPCSILSSLLRADLLENCKAPFFTLAACLRFFQHLTVLSSFFDLPRS